MKEVVCLVHVIIAFSTAESVISVPNTAGPASYKNSFRFLLLSYEKSLENEELNLICEYWKTGIMGSLSCLLALT